MQAVGDPPFQLAALNTSEKALELPSTLHIGSELQQTCLMPHASRTFQGHACHFCDIPHRPLEVEHGSGTGTPTTTTSPESEPRHIKERRQSWLTLHSADDPNAS